MTQQTIKLDEGVRIEIENVAGELTLKGWNRSELQLQGFNESDSLKQDDGLVSLNFSEDGVLRLPHNTPVEIGSVGGDAVFRGLDGTLDLKVVGGDLSLSDVGAVTIDAVGADLSAKRVRNDLVVKDIGGDCVVHGVNGKLSIQGVGGDLVAKDIQKDVVVENVGGDAVLQDLDGQFSAKAVGGDLHLSEIKGGIEAIAGGDATVAFSPVPWQAYSIQAGGDIYAEVPEDANAEFELESEIRKIEINLKEEVQTIREKTHSLTLGEGGPSVSLSAGGEIVLTSEESKRFPGAEIDFGILADMGSMAEEMAHQTSAQIEEQLGMLEEHLNSHLADLSEKLDLAGLSEEKARKVQERVEEARQRAAHSAQRAQSKLERKLAQAQRKVARRARKEKRRAEEFDIETIFAAKEKVARTVSDEDRMMILKMLQDKTITTEQADKLLSALEGGA